MCRKAPVLSEQMTETEPRASTECSFLTIALRFDIRSTPSARVTVVTIGRPSGMAATASETACHGKLSIGFKNAWVHARTSDSEHI